MALSGSAENPIELPHGWTIVKVGGPRTVILFGVHWRSGSYSCNFVIRGTPRNHDLPMIERSPVGAAGSNLQWDGPDFLPDGTTPTPPYPSYWNENNVPRYVPEGQDIPDFANYYSVIENGYMGTDNQDSAWAVGGGVEDFLYFVVNVSKLVQDFELETLYVDVYVDTVSFDPGNSFILIGALGEQGGSVAGFFNQGLGFVGDVYSAVVDIALPNVITNFSGLLYTIEYSLPS